MEFNKIEWLACLVVTGAMRMTPTTVMKVLPRLFPLHMTIQLEVQAVIYRIMCNNQWKPKSTDYSTIKSLYTWRINPSYLWSEIK